MTNLKDAICNLVYSIKSLYDSPLIGICNLYLFSFSITYIHFFTFLSTPFNKLYNSIVFHRRLTNIVPMLKCLSYSYIDLSSFFHGINCCSYRPYSSAPMSYPSSSCHRCLPSLPPKSAIHHYHGKHPSATSPSHSPCGVHIDVLEPQFKLATPLLQT